MIKGKNVQLRFFKDEQEIDALYSVYNDLNQRAMTDHTELISKAGMKKRFAENNGWSSPEGVLVVTTTEDEPVGTISSHRTNEFELAIGYRVYSDKHRGKGVMSEALRLFSAYLFNCTPHVTRLMLVTAESNVPSRKLAEKCGYMQEGVLRKAYFYRGEITDWILYSLLREEADSFQ